MDPDGSLGRSGSLQSWLSRVYDTSVGDIKLIKDKVRDFGRIQSVTQGVQKVIGLLEETNPKESSNDLISKVQEIVVNSCQVGTDRTSGTFFHDVALDIPRILREDAMYGQDSKVPTGVPALDDALDGGPGAGTINVIMGPPNRGKSTVLTFLGFAASQHFAQKALTTGVEKSVIHITCEMTEPDIAAKYAAAMSGVETNLLTCSTNYHQIMEKRTDQFAPINIKFYPPGTPTVDDIQWYISNLITLHKIDPGLLIVDYADKLRGMEDDRFNGMGVIYNRFIEMGHKFGFPVWTGSQINRDDAKKKRHGVTGAAESWKKVEIADNIILLNQTEDEHEEGLLILGLGKIRRGSRQVGSVNCRVDYGRVIIKQLEGSESQAVTDSHRESTTVEEPEMTIPDIPLSPEIDSEKLEG